MIRYHLLGIAFALATVVQPVHANENVVTPFELVRTLQRVQDRIALGSVRAHQAQRKLLQHIAMRFASIDPVAWREPRNTRALILFLLAGGDSKTGRTIHTRGLDEAVDNNLVEAALAYAEGRRKDARRLLRDVEPQNLAASLGGHVALVKSGLYQKTNPKKSMHYLDLARLLMPGTLIEEASLRRGIVAAGNDGNLETFRMLAGQYLRRFAASVYSSDFDAKFALYLVKLDFLESPTRQSQFHEMVFSLDPTRLRKLYLSVARHAVVAGQTSNAAFAALRAEGLSTEMSVEMERARAYQAVALVTKDPSMAKSKLEKLNSDKLSDSDLQIVGAALALTEKITRRPIMKKSTVKSPHGADKTMSAEALADSKPDGVEVRAEQLLEKVDEMLEGNRQ